MLSQTRIQIEHFLEEVSKHRNDRSRDPLALWTLNDSISEGESLVDTLILVGDVVSGR